MSVEDIYELYKQFPAITTDSRECRENSIFIALKGEHFNGNKFAKTAIEKGCRYAIVDEKEYADNERIILVNNCLETLQQLANYHRRQLKTSIIGITGTNGKTTTKELVAAVLSQKFNVLFTQRNLNNHIGVPLTLLKLTAGHELAVVEMGANHPKEIAELCAIAEPDYGIITNIGKAHLEGFGSFQGVINTKGELYDYIRNKGGKIFINEDNPVLEKISRNIEKITYSQKNPDAFVYAAPADNELFLKILWKDEIISTHLIGLYNAENILAAICIGKYFGVEKEKIVAAIENYKPANNRSQFAETEKNKLVIDAYNANPTSMQAAIRNFAGLKSERKALILGDMLELGDNSAKEHQAIIDCLQELHFNDVLLVGEEFSKTKSPFKTFPHTGDCAAYLQQNPFFDYTILIKGSRGMKLEVLREVL
ncbi:MAG: UDP-N-acetylmuramoyl-tripeptide--D-alanyl-D-alanine ligase [Prevotellaceae bacterium]|jgi:UDP-N-acetylmuramoyl-tripeptide--D-alanyl-D-alanine ligase|nr:UDP-N-acetylmuramoyl-tripeptide--D-alanyl-D-alanine ligase [Prevotellaceae bacterium]